MVFAGLPHLSACAGTAVHAQGSRVSDSEAQLLDSLEPLPPDLVPFLEVPLA